MADQTQTPAPQTQLEQDRAKQAALKSDNEIREHRHTQVQGFVYTQPQGFFYTKRSTN